MSTSPLTPIERHAAAERAGRENLDMRKCETNFGCDRLTRGEAFLPSLNQAFHSHLQAVVLSAPRSLNTLELGANTRANFHLPTSDSSHLELAIQLVYKPASVKRLSQKEQTTTKESRWEHSGP
jgi:hypothetical protein